MRYSARFHLSAPLHLSVLFALLLNAGAHARPLRFHQGQEIEPLAGLIGSEIGDIEWSGRHLWVATESGLARLDPNQSSGLRESDWVTFTELNGLGRGAISALATVGDTVWTATLFDTTVADLGTFQVGDGLAVSFDAGATWRHIPNDAIFDPTNPDFDEGPFGPVQNPCYGLSIDGDTVWAAFFAGSTVRSRDGGQTWERVLPDGADQRVFAQTDNGADSLQVMADSLSLIGGDAEEIARLLAGADSLRSQNLLHNTFDVLAHDDTVWVGTSSGLTHSLDGGNTWKISRARLASDGSLVPGHIAGNWVVSLARQLLPDGNSAIWAGTRPAGEGEFSGMVFSLDAGESWTATGSTSAWGFTFTPERIWAGTDNGLLASADGLTWEEIPVEDSSSREQLRGAFVGLQYVDEVLWVGAENGLGRSADRGQTWQIIKSPVKPIALDSGETIGETGLADSVRTYAAPNPFSPNQGELARLFFSLSRDAKLSIRIYDFASRLVRTLVEEGSFAGQMNHGENWDGTDEDGQPVANGVYFYRIELDSGQQAFGKVVVLD